MANRSNRQSTLLAVAAAAALTVGASGLAAPAEAITEEEVKALAEQMEPFNIRVVGLATGTSEWNFLEQPFWSEKVQELSGGKVTVDLNSQSELNLQGPEVFRLTSQGTFNVADIVANYGAGEVPELDGLDLAGVAPSMEEVRDVLDAYAPVVREALQERFQLVTLGYDHSTAQVFWCAPEIGGLEDLQGKRVRVSSSTLADLVSGLGGNPITMAFAEVVPALERGVIDCVITGTMSGNTAKFYEVADYVYPLVVGWAPRLRIANAEWLESLDESQREWLEAATEYYFSEMSRPVSERNSDQGLWCSVGDERCTLAGEAGVEKADMNLVEVTEEDLETLRQVVEAEVLPSFAETCGEACTARWNETVGEVMDLEARP